MEEADALACVRLVFIDFVFVSFCSFSIESFEPEFLLLLLIHKNNVFVNCLFIMGWMAVFCKIKRKKETFYRFITFALVNYFILFDQVKAT